jgi:glycosyltransferase involved in cell wall biosynthesis
VRADLVHGEHIYLCERESGAALAEAVRVLHADPQLRQKLAEQGLQKFRESFDLAHLGRLYRSHLEELIRRHSARAG